MTIKMLRSFLCPIKGAYGASIVLLWLLALPACFPAKKSSTPVPNRPNKPLPPKQNTPIDTIRWTPNNGKPPIKNTPSNTGKPIPAGETYHIGFLLPFLTNQAAGEVPEKSRLALQFYAGAKIALEQVSQEGQVNLVVDTWDTQASDAEFQTLLNTNTRIHKPSVFIGPIRSSHVSTLATWAKAKHKIVLSPDSPNANLATDNPDFIQLNPSLRAHCQAIVKYVRSTKVSDAITLVCKEKEADRLQYFKGSTGITFTELVVPDETLNFNKYDLKKYFRPGKTAVFVLPTWSSQDFVMAFLRKLKEVKGSTRVEVYGMPQWRGFEAIEPDYLRELNVHVSAASYLDYQAEEVKAFQQKFFEATGTIPDEDGFNGYDVTLFTARMLAKYGLSFPEKLEKESYAGLHGTFAFSKIFSESALDSGSNKPDYLENTWVHILKFGKKGFAVANK
jgi:hypothetical protein